MNIASQAAQQSVHPVSLRSRGELLDAGCGAAPTASSFPYPRSGIFDGDGIFLGELWGGSHVHRGGTVPYSAHRHLILSRITSERGLGP
jgi:hypothetical protein